MDDEFGFCAMSGWGQGTKFSLLWKGDKHIEKRRPCACCLVLPYGALYDGKIWCID